MALKETDEMLLKWGLLKWLLTKSSLCFSRGKWFSKRLESVGGRVQSDCPKQVIKTTSVCVCLRVRVTAPGRVCDLYVVSPPIRAGPVAAFPAARFPVLLDRGQQTGHGALLPVAEQQGAAAVQVGPVDQLLSLCVLSVVVLSAGLNATRSPGEVLNPCCFLFRWPRLPLESSSTLDFGATPVNESKVG
jgi:hypothetical protein